MFRALRIKPLIRVASPRQISVTMRQEPFITNKATNAPNAIGFSIVTSKRSILDRRQSQQPVRALHLVFVIRQPLQHTSENLFRIV